MLWGLVVHLVCDWLLQNHWMAINKASLRHPAAWVHGGIHALGMALVFPWPVALAFGVSHMWIDTREPMAWWRKALKQTTEGPYALSVALWGDQVAHIAIVALVALLS